MGPTAAIVAVLSLATVATLALPLAGSAARELRERQSERALALAREALLAYAAARPIDAIVGPGYLPCPDLDNDGWAEPTCGSMSGDTGQAQRLGRLPWKTLGIPDLRDGHGERLWYAVSSKYKGLLNCTVSAACIDMSPEVALGTITVRDPGGRILHDGRIADPRRAQEGGVAAVVFAPGPPLAAQDRTCPPGACNATGQCIASPPAAAPACNPVNYLDRALFEDNADFIDRNDAAGRTGNANGFIRGPVRLGDGAIAVNDRLAEIAFDDIMPRVMQRVASEVAACLRATSPLPAPAPLCRQAGGDPAQAWDPVEGTRFGRVPAFRFSGCAIDAAAPSPNWWLAWRRHVFYAVDALELAGRDGATLASGVRAAVIVAGPPLAALAQSRAAPADARAASWLEEAHADLERANPNPAAPDCLPEPIAPCPAGSACNRIVRAPRSRTFNDVVATVP